IKSPTQYTLFPYTTLFRSDGKFLLAGYRFPSDGKLRNEWKELKLWEVATGKVVRTFRLSEFITYLRFLPNGEHFLSGGGEALFQDRKSTRLNSSHQIISYA